MIKVLVTGAGALLGQGIIRSLKWSSLKTQIVAVDPSPLSAGLYWGDAYDLLPLASAPQYLVKVEELLRKHQPDIMMIGTDIELPIFAKNKIDLEKKFQTKIVVSSQALIDIANDKYLTFQFLKKNGFSFPASILPGEEQRLVEQVGFPLIVKPRVGARSIGVNKVTTYEELRQALAKVENPVIQEYVGSDEGEYTAGLICFDGEVKGSIIMRRDLRDGNTYRAFVEKDSIYDRELRRIALSLNPYGPINLQFRVDKAGNVKIFEINSRFSGTTPLRARAGFNEVEFCIQSILNGVKDFSYNIRDVTILRHWSETVVEKSNLIGEL